MSVENWLRLAKAAQRQNKLVIGSSGDGSPVTISTGDGSTDLKPSFQYLGDSLADSALIIGLFSTTDANAPRLCFLKSGNAAVGSNTTVASGERLGDIVWFGADGTDFESPAAAIRGVVSNTVGTGDMPGALVFLTTADGGETLTECWRFTDQQIFTSTGGRTSNVTASKSAIFQGGIAFTDVANAWIDDATQGTGTTTHYIGNQTITTSSDSRIKKDVETWHGKALDAISRAPRLVEYTYDLPGGGTSDGWGPNGRGRYLGYIAQETIEWAPWIVNAGAGKDCPKCRAGETCDNTDHAFWHVQYDHLVPLLVKAVQELTSEVNALKRRVV